MATIRKRGRKWQVQIRRLGHKPISRTFLNHTDALQWARQLETLIDRQAHAEVALARPVKLTLRDLLQRYLKEVAPKKRSYQTDAYRIRLICRHRLADCNPFRIISGEVASFRDERLEVVSTETVRQDMILIRQVIDIARKEWGLQIPVNPVDQIRKPPPAKPRTRRLNDGEMDILLAAASLSRNSVIRDAVRFAVATGMRRGEILRAEWVHVDWEASTLEIPVAKNGHGRIIPLTPEAMAIIREREAKCANDSTIFPTTAVALKLAWQRIRKKAGVCDLRFHDLRREAISRFFEIGLNVPEVALISGHRDYRMLATYTRLRADELARKLKRLAKASSGVNVVS